MLLTNASLAIVLNDCVDSFHYLKFERGAQAEVEILCVLGLHCSYRNFWKFNIFPFFMMGQDNHRDYFGSRKSTCTDVLDCQISKNIFI